MLFYRVCNTGSQQGLWYDFDGNFTGNIHTQYNFCTHTNLLMDYDPKIVGWLSAAQSFDQLLQWFPLKDIIKLQKDGYCVHIYDCDVPKFYEKFEHPIIAHDKITLVNKMILSY